MAKKTKPMTEEELKTLSSNTFGGGYTLSDGVFGNAPQNPAYDTQTRKFVGSDWNPQRPVEPAPMTDLQRAKQYEGLPPHLQSAADRMGMSAQSKGVVDAARSPLSGINAFDTSIQGMDVDRTAIATRVPEMPSGLAGSSPFNLAGATQQTSPLLTNQVPEMPVNVAQAKTPIQTPYGTVYATAGQMGNERVSEMGGLPAQSARLENIGERARQSAAVKQMRERGAKLGQQGIQRQEQFFSQKRAERDALRVAEGEARASGVRPMDIMRAREGVQGPSTMAGIRRDFESYQPKIGPMVPTSTLVANAVSGFTRGLPVGGSRPLPFGAMGPSGYALYEQQQAQRRAGGATGPYSNARTEQRRRTRDIARSQGMQPAYSRPVQEEQEDYFRRRGLM